MKRLYFNGIHGRTGRYFCPPLDLETLQPYDAAIEDAQARLETNRNAEIARISDRQLNGRRRFSPAPGPGGFKTSLDDDPADLSRVGWGVVFPKGLRSNIRQALSELLELRRSQVGGGPGIYREFEYDSSRYGQGAGFLQFLEDNGVGPGQVDIRRMPYYLLIVGSPAQIPFGFQFQLDAQYAVGRLYFRQWTQYRQYARNVVRSEEQGTAKPRSLALFGVRTPNDWLTEQTTEHLVLHLSRVLKSCLNGRLETHVAEQATKDRLKRLMGGSETPSVLLTTSHGVCYHNGDELQRKYQGALLCREWPGLDHIPSQEYWVSADDIAPNADLSGLIAFLYGCFTGGTPEVSSFFDPQAPEADLLSNHPFVARMPQRLLSHPKGALAVIGHVDQTYVHSFLWGASGSQTHTFESALRCLMQGKPVGLAMESFGQRYAHLAAWLHEQRNYSGDDGELQSSRLFMACHDARSYLVLGDPAVRLPRQHRAAPSSPLPPHISTSAAPLPHSRFVGTPGRPCRRPVRKSDSLCRAKAAPTKST